MNLLTQFAAVSTAALIFSAANSAQPYRSTLVAPTKKVVAAKTDSKPKVTSEKPKNKAEIKTVVVEPGDSLSSIASDYQTTWRRLYDKNEQIIYPDLIYPGDKLVIPTKDEELDHRPLPTGSNRPAPTPSSPAKSAQTTTTPTSDRQVSHAPAVASGSVWDRLAQCESSGNWHINTGNGFYGGLQFTISSWRAVGGTGLPSNASRAEQIMRAKKLQAIQGWGAWPACSAKLGLR